MKKLKYFLQKWDGVWGVPLGVALFYFVGLLLAALFGYGTGSYDIAFFQPLFLAAAIVIGAANIGVLGVYFTLRGMHRYLYGQKNKDGEVENPSKDDWYKLKPLQRFVIALVVVGFFISAIVFVYLKLV
jgi:hypothetical protein